MEKWNEISTRILKGEVEQAELSSVLSGITDDISDTLSIEQHIREENEKLEQTNKELKEANYNLFIRQGKILEDVKSAENDRLTKQPEVRAATIKIDDLFKED